jgi:hypothetical protein
MQRQTQRLLVLGLVTGSLVACSDGSFSGDAARSGDEKRVRLAGEGGEGNDGDETDAGGADGATDGSSAAGGTGTATDGDLLGGSDGSLDPAGLGIGTGDGESGWPLTGSVEMPVSRDCSKVGAQSAGTTVSDAAGGVSLALFPVGGAGGAPAALWDDPVTAQAIKSGIIDEGRITLPKGTQIPDGQYSVVLCDLALQAACLAETSTLDGATFGANIRHFKAGMVGIGGPLAVTSGQATLTAPLTSLYKAKDPAVGAECDDQQSPLLVDLTGAGLSLGKPSAGVAFDLDGDGAAERISWMTTTSVGALARDLDGNGTIDDGRELFGNHTVLGGTGGTGAEAANGFEALAALDVNGDGHVTADDPAFAELVLWIDSDFDGRSTPDELHGLPSLKIESLAVTYADVQITDRYGNSVRQTSSAAAADGRRLDVVDLWFRVL